MITLGSSRARAALALLVTLCVGGCGAGEDLVATAAGGLQVTTELSGSGDDPDGVIVVVDGDTRHSLLPDSTLRLPGLGIGRHTLGVEELAAGCTLSGPNPRDVIVVPDSVVAVVLDVSCASTVPTGTLVAAVLTRGVDSGTGGYSAVLDASAARALESNDTIAFTELSADSHVVRLSGVANHCSVAGANPWTFRVEPPDTATITWEITCWSPPIGRIAFSRTEPEGGSARSVYMINADGTGLTRLTGPDGNVDQEASWSPDGTEIAFTNDTGSFDRPTRLRILRVATRALVQLPIGSFSPSRIQWSPDGTQLSFDDFDDDVRAHIYLVNANGSSSPKRLAVVGEESGAAWSPDGSRLAFIGQAGPTSPERVYVTSRSGTNTRPVTPADLVLGFLGGDVDWSPDGSRLVFSAAHPFGEDFGNDIYVIGTDGTGLVNLTLSPPFSANLRPRWSPDGRLIAYTCSDVDRDGTRGDICTIPAEGGPRTNLTKRLAFYFDFLWSPDGSKLLFAGPGESEFGGDDLFVMNGDGSGMVRLTNSSGHEELGSWTR